MAMVTTVGRMLVAESLPDGLYDQDRPLDKGSVAIILGKLAKEHPDKYVDALQRMNDLGRGVATSYGGVASLSLKDLRAPESMRKVQSEMRRTLEAIREDRSLSSEEKQRRVADQFSKMTSGLEAKLIESLPPEHSLGQQIRVGTRGDKVQLQQMMLGDMLMVDPLGRIIPQPGLTGYSDGLSPMEYWIGATSGRKGSVDVQLATADAGYYGKTMTSVAHRMVVTEKDCGAGEEQGLVVDSDDDANIGAMLARDAGPYKAGTIVTRDMVSKLPPRILLRSTLTCRAADGICQHCAGLRERGEFPEMGEAVGVNAARSFVEPVTQAKLKSKHVGGVATTDKLHSLDSYQQIKQFGQVPQEFVGGSVLTGVDGRVSRVVPAPQGGTYVQVGTEQYHVPHGVDVVVKPGDQLEAGDMLSSGIPNPAEIVRHKGLGDGRKYYMEQFSKLLDSAGASTHRRNLEPFARAFVSRVRITEPEGLQGHLIDDVVDYDSLAANWTPRDGAALKKVTEAHNLYLEQPYLHYTIGTRVTPKISRTLRENGIADVLANAAPPPFEPVVMRATDFTRKDKDWMVRLGGENLAKATLEAAQRGSVSERKSTSYFPRLVNITES